MDATNIRFALVGWGYRSQAWLDAARGTGLDCVGVVVRSPRETPVPNLSSLEAARAAGAQFLVSSVSWASTPEVTRQAVELGLPILSETPPAPDREALRQLWREVGDSGLVQVAEQYPFYPSHAARLALVASGLIGEPTQVQVSSTQTYHAVALMRAHLGQPMGPVTVRATTVTSPLVQHITRAGWTHKTEPDQVTTTHGVIDFGGGRSGIYDFTDLQTRNLLRHRRLVVRGDRGELDGDSLVAWVDAETVASSRIERRQSGHDLDMSGYASESLNHGQTILWRNRWPDQPWSDDALATAAILTEMADWVAGGGAGSADRPGPYPLRQGLQDTAIGFALGESAELDRAVVIDDEPWW